MTVRIMLTESHRFRWYLLFKGLKRLGLRQASCPSEGTITGEASEELVNLISQTPGIESVESMPLAASTLSYPV